MQLPIFNGMSSEQFSDFIEYLPLDFETYEPGETIVEIGEAVLTLKCIVSGKAVVEHEAFGGMIKVEEIWNAGTILGMDRLFGMDTTYSFTARAKEKCGILQFSKQRFLELIRTRDICLINFLNYVSMRAQRPSYALSRSIGRVQLHRLESAVLLLSDTVAETVKFTLDDSEKLPCFELDPESRQVINDFIERGLIIWETGKSMTIPSRREFLKAMKEIKEVNPNFFSYFCN